MASTADTVLAIIVAMLPFLFFVVFLVGNLFLGRKYTAKRRALVVETVEKALGPYSKEITTVDLKPEVIEFRCVPNRKQIGVQTLNYTMINQTFATNVLLNKLIKGKEKLFIGVKFREAGIDIDPAYKFYFVPYRNKGLIRKNFEVYVQMDDVPTDNPSVDRLYMIKANLPMEIRHFATHAEFLGKAKSLEPYLDLLSIQPAKEATDPHLQMTFTLPTDKIDLVPKFLDFFFLVARLHVENNETVKKLTSSKKVKQFSSKTKSAKKRSKKKSKGGK